MRFSLGGALVKNKIGIGCITLLSSIAVAGITEVEIQNQTFSKLAKSYIEKLRSTGGSSSHSGQPITTQQVIQPFVTAGQATAGIVTKYLWPTIQEIPSAIKSFSLDYMEWFRGIKHFLQSIVSSEIFQRFFDNFHLKIWKVLNFAVGGKERTKFIELFKSSSRESTVKTIKFLSGLSTSENNSLKASPNVFSYLLSRWMDNPDLVTDKFERLSKEIDKWTKKFTSGSSGSSGQGLDTKNVYELDIQSLDGYLNVKKGYSENMYKMLWFSEIASKITTGRDLTFGAKSSASLFGNFLGTFII